MEKATYRGRRYWPRYNANFSVYCSGKGFFKATNVGNRGLFLEGLDSVKPGQRVRMSFKLPDWDFPYELIGEVTHKANLATQSGIISGCGVKFIGAIVGNAALKGLKG
jgi:hypothetical protein